MWSMKLVFVLCLVMGGLALPGAALAQVQADSLYQDSLPMAADTIPPSSQRDTGTTGITLLRDSLPAPPVKMPDTTLRFFNQYNPYLAAGGKLIYQVEEPFSAPQKDALFYVLGGMLLFLGVIRIGFAKYFSDMMRIFFQTAFRQKSIREQLLQNTLASLLFNLFFCFSAGLFLYQLAGYRQWLTGGIWWQNAAFCIALIMAVYAVKYIGLQLSGWLFGMKEVAETYMFMVFLINKVVGILLLPTTIVLAIGSPKLQPVLVVVSLLGLATLYVYRYIIAFPLLRLHTRLSSFHFFLYLCAFEIIPVLLIYKLLLSILNR
jgi:Domain of unknown function (DUF4271)